MYFSDTNKENEQLLSQPDGSEQSASVISSKDTQHILRLAALLHVIQQYVNPVLRVQEEQTTELPLKRIHQAKCMYFTIIQQKAAFLQVIPSLNGVCLILKVSSFIATGSRFVYYMQSYLAFVCDSATRQPGDPRSCNLS